MPPSPPDAQPCRRIPVAFREVVRGAREHWLHEELGLSEVAARLEGLFAAECGAEEEEIKEAFAPLARTGEEPGGRHRTPAYRHPDDDARWRRFLDRFAALLERANYEALARETLEASARVQGIPGLRVQVDFSAYDRLAVYTRGRGVEVRRVRKWYAPWRRRTWRIPTYERVVLLARLGTERGLHLKLFRDIPQDDLEALLPGTRFKMRLFDHIKIGGAGSTAVATFLMRGAKWAFVPKALLLPLLVLGSIFYMGKTIWGYFRAKDTYRARLMNELFYQMMDSDSGVISRVVDEAEDEEAKETFLAWAGARVHGPCDAAALAAAVESHLRQVHGCSVAFDLPDALTKLRRYRLVCANHDTLVRAVPAGVASVRLAALHVRGSHH